VLDLSLALRRRSCSRRACAVTYRYSTIVFLDRSVRSADEDGDVVRAGAEYFTSPALGGQRRYEAMRACLAEEMPAAEVADRFRGHYEIATDVPARHWLRIAFHSLAATL